MPSPLHSKLRRDELAAEHARLVANALLLGGRDMPDRGRSAPADVQRLRGIPVVGARGVGGAIPGTKPGIRER